MSTEDYEWLAITGGFVCMTMAWGIGANDAANAFATSVGARAITLKQATVIAAIFEFSGAFLLGANVTNTVRKGITNYEEFEDEPELLMLGMFCALCSSSLWLYLATRYSMPVSTTQSIVGSIIGFAIVIHGRNAVQWDAVIRIVIFWVLLPIFSGIVGVLLFLPTRNLLLRRKDAYELLLKGVWPIYVFIVVFIMTLFMLFKGLKRLNYEATWPEAIGIGSACGFGIALIAYFALVRSGILANYVEKRVKEDQKWAKERQEIYDQFAIAKSQSEYYQNSSEKAVATANNNNAVVTQGVEMQVDVTPDRTPDASGDERNTPDASGDEAKDGAQTTTTTTTAKKSSGAAAGGSSSNNLDVKHPTGAMNDSTDVASIPVPVSVSENTKDKIKRQLTKGVNVDVYSDLERYELEIQANSEEFDPRVERSFNWLQVTSASLDILAHGSNDVANAVAPFAAIVALYEDPNVLDEVEVPWWVAFMGASGLVVGLSTYGYKIIKAIGVRLVSMSSSRGYSIELSSALSVIIASYYGYPASTTHCQIGATLGIGVIEVMRPDSKLSLKHVVNWRLCAVVFIGWILTVLISAFTCGALFAFMAFSPCAN